jgi:hypothetical protein
MNSVESFGILNMNRLSQSGLKVGTNCKCRHFVLIPAFLLTEREEEFYVDKKEKKVFCFLDELPKLKDLG